MRITLSGIVLFCLFMVTCGCLADTLDGLDSIENDQEASRPQTCLEQCIRTGEEEDSCMDDCLQIAMSQAPQLNACRFTPAPSHFTLMKL